MKTYQRPSGEEVWALNRCYTLLMKRPVVYAHLLLDLHALIFDLDRFPLPWHTIDWPGLDPETLASTKFLRGYIEFYHCNSAIEIYTLYFMDVKALVNDCLK